jgi:hypothetical protein
VAFALRLTEAADPSLPRVVGSVPPQDMVHLIDEAQGEFAIGLVAGPPIELQKVADGEGVGPQVSGWRSLPNQARALDEVLHQVVDKGRRFRLGHGHWQVLRESGLLPAGRIGLLGE